MKYGWSAVIIPLMCGVCPWQAWAAPSRVDLQIESIHIQPARPTSADTVTAVASIRNNGSEAAEQFDVAMAVTAGGKKVKTIKELPALGRLPRSGSGLSIPLSLGKLPEGEYEVLATVDASGYIQETNEANNQRAKRFQVYSPRNNPRTY